VLVSDPIALYSVSHTDQWRTSVLSTANDYANIRVVNNRVSSNLVTVRHSAATVVFHQSSRTELGTPAALRQDSSIVFSGNPARRGETISIYVTGLARCRA
jgi:uncharacterized protein (TIGR03437 family)